MWDSPICQPNMSDHSQMCPSVWQEITTPHRVCEKDPPLVVPTNLFEISFHVDPPSLDGFYLFLFCLIPLNMQTGICGICSCLPFSLRTYHMPNHVKNDI